MSKERKPTNRELLSDLVTDAASALAKQASIVTVENLLKEIDNALSDTSLNLARDKRENAQQDIQNFFAGKLTEYYERSREVVGKKETLNQELIELQLDNKIEAAERDLAAAKRDLSRIYQRELRALQDVEDQILKNVDTINNSINFQTTIETKLPGKPEWAESSQ